MSDRYDPTPDDPTLRAPVTPPPPAVSDDRLAAAQDRAAAAEHRAETAESRYGDADERPRPAVVGHRPTYGLGSLLALLGALAVAVSIFLSWVQDAFSATGETESANDVPVQFLWDTIPADSDPSLLFVLLPAAVLILVGAFIPRARWTTWLGGLVALAVPVLFTISAGRLLSDQNSPDGAFDFIDIGVWVCAIGALVAIIGASLLPRREVVTERTRSVEY